MQLAQTAAPGPSLSIACINLVANASDLPSAVSRALRRDPDKVVFIGQPSDVMVRTFRESGHLVEVLPAASEPPAGATLVLTSIYNAAEALYARLKREHSLRDDTLFYNVDRNFPAAEAGTLLMPLAFSPEGRGSWGSVVNFDRVAAKHGIVVVDLKQLCLLPDPNEETIA